MKFICLMEIRWVVISLYIVENLNRNIVSFCSKSVWIIQNYRPVYKSSPSLPVFLPPWGMGEIKGSGDGEGNERGKKEKKKEIWGKHNFLQYQIIKLN